MSGKVDAKHQLKALKKSWELLSKKPNVFAYGLRIANKKYLEGSLKFYLEFNPERSVLRRAPQKISSLNPDFDPATFNFTKVKPVEVMFSVPYDHSMVAFIINKSPITKYHSLICPDVDDCIPQRINKTAIGFAIRFLLNLKDSDYRIGYNSPGALASVNHLHLHLVNIKKKLYIDTCDLEHLTSGYVYRLSPNAPTEAICFLFDKNEKEDEIDAKTNGIFNFVTYLCENNYPHNLFMTWSKNKKLKNKLMVFVYARAEHCEVKDLVNLNLGFSEMSGFVPLGRKVLFEQMTEALIIKKIVEETGSIYENIYNYFSDTPVFESDDTYAFMTESFDADFTFLKSGHVPIDDDTEGELSTSTVISVRRNSLISYEKLPKKASQLQSNENKSDENPPNGNVPNSPQSSSDTINESTNSKPIEKDPNKIRKMH